VNQETSSQASAQQEHITTEAREPEYSDDPVINAVCVKARKEADRILAEIDQFFVDAANVPLPLPEVTEEQRKSAQHLENFELAPSPEDIKKFGGPLVAQQEQQAQEGGNSTPTGSSAYGRRLVEAIKAASATRNVYYFVRSGTQWVTSATYQEDSNCIQINTPRGPVSVHAREWQNLRDSHGRSIAASQPEGGK
jgi:hypothetical protein